MLRDQTGKRKYLTPTERLRFLEAARKTGGEIGAFCSLIGYTGCRLSEALELTPDQIDCEERVVVIRSLKKRGREHYRAVPIPGCFLTWLMHTAHSINRDKSEKIWPWSRTTAWSRVKEIMVLSRIHGPHATPKGLRHAFGIHATQCGLPLNTVQKWLRHSNIEMTAIYADAVGEEERFLAKKMWDTRINENPEFNS